MKNLIINLMAKFGYEPDTKEPREFLIDTLEKDPIQALTDFMYKMEKLNHKIKKAKEGTNEEANDILYVDEWEKEVDEFISNIEILIREFKVSNEDQKKAEEKAESMLNMWILKKFTKSKLATRKEHFS